jgi:hypothetical protein
MRFNALTPAIRLVSEKKAANSDPDVLCARWLMYSDTEQRCSAQYVLIARHLSSKERRK